MTFDEVMSTLRAGARPGELAGMARFGMNPVNRLGWSVPGLRALGRQLGQQHDLALKLAASGVPDAQILAAYVADPRQFTVAQLNTWVASLNAWDTCDQACSNAFARSPLAWGRVPVWARRRPEFERRAAFALVAALTVHDKSAADDRFLAMLPLIEQAADDERNFVKKSVNWALRQIGKRNATLRVAAIDCAERLRARHSPSARWIAADALREWKAK